MAGQRPQWVPLACGRPQPVRDREIRLYRERVLDRVYLVGYRRKGEGERERDREERGERGATATSSEEGLEELEEAEDPLA